MILALETSTGVGGAALLDGSRLIAEQTLAADQLERAAAHIDEGEGWIEQARQRIEASPESILELMKIQSGFPGTVKGLRVEEPTLDLVYERLIGVDRGVA